MHQPHKNCRASAVLQQIFLSTTIVTLTFLLTEQRARWHAVPA